MVLSTVLLATGTPEATLATSTSWAWSDVGWLALLVVLYAAVSAPFDLLGGHRLPRRYDRPVARGYGRVLVRGVVAHGVCLVVVGLALLVGGRAGGDAGALAAAAVLMVGLLTLQVPLAVIIGGVRRSGACLQAADPSFVGGIVGLPGRDHVVLCATWDADTGRIQAARREAVRVSGARALGVVVAVAFNLSGLAVALWATDTHATSVAGLATLALWMTLWSFLGLLVLPSFSRPAVVAVDRATMASGIDREDLTRALRRLDAAQDDEPRRNGLVETIFHPVPSLERRLAALDAPGAELPQPWHTARMALFLSWASFGLLSRAVHCNCGRPELWVLFPGD